MTPASTSENMFKTLKTPVPFWNAWVSVCQTICSFKIAGWIMLTAALNALLICAQSRWKNGPIRSQFR